MSKVHRSAKADEPGVRFTETDPFCHESTAAAVRHLTALVEAQARVIRDYETALARSRDIFEQASAAARLGTWECDLRTETLQWSGGTYDMFDIPRGSPLVRKQTLRCYPEASLKALEAIRTRAIAQRTDFNLDAEIVTASGNRRWIRITAMVECTGTRPTRLFGIKQDITEERERSERTRYLAEFDELTGLANRSQFQSRLSEICEVSGTGNHGGALLLIDLDGFKDVNDSLGHATGDDCLKQVAQRLARICGDAIIVARIGGDEFAVVIGPQIEPHRIEAIATGVVMLLSQPIESRSRHFTVGASVGIATVSGCTSSELFQRADTALYAAKSAGRNTFRWWGRRGG